MQLPTLANVPRHDDLIIKASTSGVTVLKHNRFLKRYTGNKNNAVDINGNLWLKAADLEKDKSLSRAESKIRQAGGEWAVHCWKQKKARVETQAVNKFTSMQIQKYDSLSTQQPTSPADCNKLSTKKPKQYKVHKREVRQRLLGFINTQAGKKELYFWTVTFPQGTSDDLGYRILNIWLTALRQYKMLKAYMRVSERQKNSTVHFHIAIPHKMNVKRANAMMRGTLKTFARRGELPFSVYQCNRYNGVDIAKNRKTGRVTNFAVKKGSRSLINYLTKYVTKNDESFSHLAWHNSREFSSLFTGVTFTVPEFQKFGFVEMLVCDIFCNGQPIGDEWRLLDADFFTFIPWKDGPPELIEQHLYQLNSYLQNQLN